MKKVIAPSKNIQDARKGNSVGLTGSDGFPVDIENRVDHQPQRVQAAKALGLDGQLADLQNTANKLQAVRRTRMGNVEFSTDYQLQKMSKR